MTSDDVWHRNRIMWGATLGLGCTPFEHVDGAAAAGYEHVSIVAHHMRALDDDGLRDLARYGRERSVTVSMIDGFYAWYPLTGSPLDGKVLDLDRLLRQAEILGSRFIGALAIPLGHPTELLTDGFAAACRRVADHGLVLTLEFAPVGGVPDLAGALAVIGPTGFASAGIVFDTWHFARGAPDYDLLASLSGTEIRCVQFSDAAAEVHGSLWEDTIGHRLHPGDGSFDLDRMTTALERIGALDWYGPEVISATQQAMGPVDAGATAGRRLDEYLSRRHAR